MRLESPLANLFGFERAPRTPAERTAVQQGLARLRDGDAMFVMSPAAGCRLQSVKLDFGALTPAFETVDGKSAPPPAAATDGHADLDADYTFHCKAPEALRQIDVALFDPFPGIQRVGVQLVTPKSQAGATLTRANRRLSW